MIKKSLTCVNEYLPKTGKETSGFVKNSNSTTNLSTETSSLNVYENNKKIVYGETEDQVFLPFRTRGQKNPKGLPKVFMLTHKDDVSIYLPKIWQMIDRHIDVALFYEDSIVPWNELNSFLSRVQLIIVPVTKKLLINKTHTLDAILQFANENYIPILPLMFEDGLDAVFRKHFGDLQYLIPESNDITSIPFDQKLKTYLDGVLVGNGVAQKVRDAFDAYIFLSYRKKDRKYAHELMRLIHQNDRFRDIAIWYDEYLVPGEDFNGAIQRALHNCNVFTLVVTPSLLERINGNTNYVMGVEYPEAKKSGKPIIPIMMAGTDWNNMQKEYPGIPECVESKKTDRLVDVLIRYLGTKNIEENTPEHNYLIGLAYLDGIDVEIDSRKALQLIVGAAENGVEEALRKLVSMYRNGKGVKRDYHKCAEWLEKLLLLLRDKHTRREIVGIGVLTCVLMELGDTYMELGQPGRAKQYYEEVKSDLEHTRNENKNAVLEPLLRDLSTAYEKMGDVEAAFNNREGAKLYYEKSFEVREEMTSFFQSSKSWRLLGDSYCKRGDIEQSLGALEKAILYYTECFKIRVALFATTNYEGDLYELGVICERLGNSEKKLGNLDLARRFYQEGYVYYKKLIDETNRVEGHNGLSIIDDGFGDIEQAKGNYKDAHQYYMDGLMIRESLASKRNTIEVRRNLAVSYNKLGNLEETQRKLESAKRYYEKALGICMALAEDTTTVEIRCDCSINHTKIGDIEYALRNYHSAKEHYEQALEIRKRLQEETMTTESFKELAIIYSKLGDLENDLGTSGHVDNVESFYLKALSTIMHVLSIGIGEVREGLYVELLYKLSDYYRANNKIDEGVIYFTKAIDVLPPYRIIKWVKINQDAPTFFGGEDWYERKELVSSISHEYIDKYDRLCIFNYDGIRYMLFTYNTKDKDGLFMVFGAALGDHDDLIEPTDVDIDDVFKETMRRYAINMYTGRI